MRLATQDSSKSTLEQLRENNPRPSFSRERKVRAIIHDKDPPKKLNNNSSGHKSKKKIRLKQVMKQFQDFKKLTQPEPPKVMALEPAKRLKPIDNQIIAQSQTGPLQPMIIYNNSGQTKGVPTISGSHISLKRENFGSIQSPEKIKERERSSLQGVQGESITTNPSATYDLLQGKEERKEEEERSIKVKQPQFSFGQIHPNFYNKSAALQLIEDMSTGDCIINKKNEKELKKALAQKGKKEEIIDDLDENQNSLEVDVQEYSQQEDQENKNPENNEDSGRIRTFRIESFAKTPYFLRSPRSLESSQEMHLRESLKHQSINQNYARFAKFHKLSQSSDELQHTVNSFFDNKSTILQQKYQFRLKNNCDVLIQKQLTEMSNQLRGMPGVQKLAVSNPGMGHTFHQYQNMSQLLLNTKGKIIQLPMKQGALLLEFKEPSFEQIFEDKRPHHSLGNMLDYTQQEVKQLRNKLDMKVSDKQDIIRQKKNINLRFKGQRS